MFEVNINNIYFKHDGLNPAHLSEFVFFHSSL